jgi:DNA polymerase II small subunit
MESEIIQRLIESGELPTPDKIKALLQAQQQDAVSITIKKTKVVDKDSSVEILTKDTYVGKKYKVNDFTEYFRNRYTFYKNLISNRPEFSNATSIGRLQQGDKATIIAAVFDIRKLPTGTMKLVLEDLTGQITAIISSKKDQEVLDKVKQLIPDEVLAFKGAVGKGVFFVDDLFWPDIPVKQRNLTKDEVYVAFSGDIHVGSKSFLPKDLNKFVSWLQGKRGNPRQRRIAAKTKYVTILGDVVDGVGIFPSQEKELDINDIYKQYDVAAKYLAEIPSDKHILVIPGNHDALRICEPQPALYKDLAAPLYDLPNVIMLPNPSTVKLHKQDDFPGVDILMYHGYSFDSFVDSVEALRLAGGYDAADKLWEFLLKRRHLAPTYGATLALPIEQDPLLITTVPDIAASGHIHKSKIGMYRGVRTISGSCWQDKTTFQLRMGHNPTPGLVPMVNLKTGHAWQLKFK